MLIESPSLAADDDRILEMKQEGSSAVAIAVPGLLPTSSPILVNLLSQ
ncbi:MAG: hypothetical protein ACYT04_26525 [Nostoc sp.]